MDTNQFRRLYFFKRKTNKEIMDCDWRSALAIVKNPLWKLNWWFIGWSEGKFLRELGKTKPQYSKKTGMAIKSKSLKERQMEAFKKEVSAARANSDKTLPKEIRIMDSNGNPLNDVSILRNPMFR